jgi:hypothetical protein
MMRLLRPPHSGIFLRSFRLHSAHYARETIAKICSLWVALATAIISQTGSCPVAKRCRTLYGAKGYVKDKVASIEHHRN